MRESEAISVVCGALHGFLDWPDQYVKHGRGTEKDAWIDYHFLAVDIVKALSHALHGDHVKGETPGPKKGGLVLHHHDGSASRPPEAGG